MCHSRGLDTTDVDPEALVQWLAEWVELSDAAGGNIWITDWKIDFMNWMFLGIHMWTLKAETQQNSVKMSIEFATP